MASQRPGPELRGLQRAFVGTSAVTMHTWTPICGSFFGLVMDLGKIYGTEPSKGTTNWSSGIHGAQPSYSLHVDSGAACHAPKAQGVWYLQKIGRGEL